MSILAIILIVLVVIVLIAVVLGFLGTRARDRAQAHSWRRNVAEADAALEEARAADRGWDRDRMTAVVRDAIASRRPDWAYSEVLLTLVDDKPGTDEDRAHFVAIDSGGAEAHVVLTRHGDQWSAEDFDWRGE